MLSRPPDDPSGATRLRDRPALQINDLSTRDRGAGHFGSLGGIRQWIESTFDTLKDQLSLERHGGRTLTGLVSRIARRLLALTATIIHNWQLGTPGRHLTAYDH